MAYDSSMSGLKALVTLLEDDDAPSAAPDIETPAGTSVLGDAADGDILGDGLAASEADGSGDLAAFEAGGSRADRAPLETSLPAGAADGADLTAFEAMDIPVAGAAADANGFGGDLLPEAGGDGAPGPAGSIATLANYLSSGYWSDTGRSTRYFNLSDTGTGSNNGVLYYNLSGNGFDANGLTEDRKVLARAAFDLYEEVLGINFVETTSTSGAVDFFFTDNVAGEAFNSSTLHSGNGGPIDYNRINVAAGWQGGESNLNRYTFQTFVHEIGHGLGLGHQGNYNAGVGTPTYDSSAIWANDSWQQSIMSYWSQSANTSITASFAYVISGMAADWYALNTLYNGYGYGVNNAFNGNTVYGVGTNITSTPYANLEDWADYNAFSIVDGSGIDTLNFSNFSADQAINLTVASAGSTTGTISDIGGKTGNMTLAVGTIIEHAVGGSGDDVITGNQYNNSLSGMAGNDDLFGGSGNDTLEGGAGDDRMYGGGGNDIFLYQNAQDAELGELLYAGSGEDKVQVRGGGTVDLRTAEAASIEEIEFYAEGTNVVNWVYLGSDELDNSGEFASDLLIDGNASTGSHNTVRVFVYGGVEDIDISGWTFQDWNISSGDDDAISIAGSENSNVLRGSSQGESYINSYGGDDTIYGNGGNDTINGGSDNDRLYGGAGNDEIYGSSGDDYLFGDAGSDSLYGGGGTNYYYGGNDTLIDRFYGGVGLDVVTAGAGGSYVFSASGGSNYLYGGTGNDSQYGGSGYDYINGGDGNDYQFGGAGNDRAYGGAGSDLLYGDAGNDFFDGGDDTDSMYGGSGDDTFAFENGDGWTTDIVNGGTDSDTVDFSAISAGSGILGFDVDDGYSFGATGPYAGNWISIENIVGTVRMDVLTGNGTANSLYGGGEMDTIYGEAGNDALYGGDGNDVIDDGFGGDSVFGGAGNDTFVAGDSDFGSGDAWYGGSGVDTLTFAAYNWGSTAGVVFDFEAGILSYNGFEETVSSIEIFFGSNGNETIVSAGVAGTYYGGAGNDIMVAEDGGETFYGGAGIDTLDTTRWNGDYEIDLETGSSNYGLELFDGFENAVLGGGNDLLDGSGADNELSGGSGDDRIRGKGGDDTINGQGGIDRLYGGGGDDVIRGQFGNDVIEGGGGADDMQGNGGVDALSYKQDSFGVSINLATGAASGGHATGDTFSGFENVIGGSAADLIIGDDNDNALVGKGGGDTLLGGLGNDVLRGQGGSDFVEGGAGADSMSGDGGRDTLSYLNDTAGVQVDLVLGTGIGGEAQGDTFSGFEDVIGGDGGDILAGDAQDNLLDGRSGNDVLLGRGGADILLGRGGDDLIEGGAGADDMNAGGGTDTLSYASDTTGVTIRLYNGFAGGGDAAGDTFTGFENLIGGSNDDALFGDDTANIINGQDGDDLLRGRGGDDVLVGGGGDDDLRGGADADIFVFADGFGADTLADFELGVTGEVIDLSGVSNITDWADLQANHLFEVAGNAVISAGGGNSITLTGIAQAALMVDDFVF